VKTKQPNWKPNSFSLGERVFNFVLSLVLLAHGASGFIYNRLDVSPPKQRLAIHLRDGPAWLMAAAMIVGACVLLSVVVDHYDKSNNENIYRLFRRSAVALGLCLVAASLASYFIKGLTE
jgi:hypothetical protein